MSRTYKDKPYKFSHPEDQVDYKFTWVGHTLLHKAGVNTKKRKEEDTKYHWMHTPSWWVRLMMGKPERRNAHLLEHKLLTCADLEDFDLSTNNLQCLNKIKYTTCSFYQKNVQGLNEILDHIDYRQKSIPETDRQGCCIHRHAQEKEP